MSVECAFKSEHPDVLAWKAAADQRARDWSKAMTDMRDQYPGYKLMSQETGFSRHRRFACLRGEGSPGDGWRFDKRKVGWVPDKRTREGKRLAEQVDALTLEWPPTPGMPDTATSGNHWHHPGLTEIDGVVWVTWGCPAEDVKTSLWTKDGLNEDLWTEAKLSEYYLAVEAACLTEAMR